jgi:TPR repeat protein
LAFNWISLAAKSGHPAVMHYLECYGLNITQLCNGYNQFKRNQAVMTGCGSGEVWDGVFAR